jgi:SPP1 gp7 family putative phage head morphogenesis protein
MPANTRYFDAALRHQTAVRNLTTQQVNELIGLLEELDKEITAKLRIRLKKFVGRPFNPKTKKFKNLLTDIHSIRTLAIREIRKKFQNNLIDLGKIEASFEKKIMEAALPVVLDLNSVSAATLTALITARPFGDGTTGGRNLKQWFDNLTLADRAKITGAIQAGLFQGESIDDIVRRVTGTRSNGFRDGTLALTRRQLEAVVRTGVNGIANTAREAVWNANLDVIQGLMWVSTLDGRTTPICMSRDGKVVPLGDFTLPAGTPRLEPPGARPPAHVACRSVMVAIFSSEGVMAAVGTRPFVRSGTSIRKMKFASKAERDAWGAANIGTVPAKVTYSEWIKRQPAQFQNETLGVTRAKLLRGGKIEIDEFTTTQGNQITLAQLAKTNPTAFMEAGLDPGNF